MIKLTYLSKMLLPFILLSVVCGAAALEVTYTPAVPVQGSTVRIEIDGVPADKLQCSIGGKTYPFFPISKNSARALIGLPADWKTGAMAVEITEKRWMQRDKRQIFSVQVASGKFPKENLTLSQSKTQLTQDPKHGEAKSKIEKALGTLSPEQKWQGTFSWPVNGKVTTVYGVTRTVNKTRPWPYHKGIDIYAPLGTPVTAPGAGRVLLAEAFPVQGRMVVLDHGQGVVTVYMHLSAIEVEAGDEVEKDQVIGKVGADGFATGPHLHWGLYVNGDSVDPKPWMQVEF